MNLIKVGSRIINLDNVTEIQMEAEYVDVYFNCVGAEEGRAIATFEGDEAKALRRYFNSLAGHIIQID